MDNSAQKPTSPDVNVPVESPAPKPNPSVWTYRGYQLEANNFATALIHLYRGEITRSNSWRSRLDVTTNWAVISTGAAISFAFAQPDTHHSVIILITALNTLFWLIEARRYRYYELWSYRLRLIETDFYAAMLVPPFSPRADWSNQLAESLLYPQFPISLWEALGRRLRRNYGWIYLVLGIAWLAKLLLYPEGVNSWSDIPDHARMGAVSGEVVLALEILFNSLLIFIGYYTMRFQQATGEVLHRPVNEIAHLKTEVASKTPTDTPNP